VISGTEDTRQEELWLKEEKKQQRKQHQSAVVRRQQLLQSAVVVRKQQKLLQSVVVVKKLQRNRLAARLTGFRIDIASDGTGAAETPADAPAGEEA